MRRWSIRTKLLISSMVILMPVLILVLLDYRAAYDRQKNQIVADQALVAQFVSSTIVDDSFEEALTIDETYAQDPIILSLDSGRINNYLAGLAPLLPDYEDALAIFDVNGNRIGSAAGGGPVNVADREWFQDVIRTGEPVVSHLVLSRASGRPIIPVAVPIRDENRRLVGVASSALSPQQFLNQLKSIQRAPGQEVFLTDRTGRLVFHTRWPDPTWEQRDVSNFLPVRSVLGGKEFRGEGAGLVTDRRMIVAMATPRMGWVVGVSAPVDVALAPLQQSLRTTLLTSAGILALTIGLAFGLAEFLSRPIKRLTANAIALGHGELSPRVVIATGDEVEELAVAFNRMAEEVRAREEALRRSEERFRLVVTHSPDVMFFLNNELRYTWIANPTPPFTAEWVLGKTDDDLFTHEQALQLIGAARKALESGAGVRVEVPLVIGEVERYFDVAYEPRRDQQGQTVGVFGYARDISEGKRAEAERERFMAILEATPDFVGMADVEGQNFYLNKAARRMLKLGETEDIPGRMVKDNHPAWATAIILNEAFPTAIREGAWHGETAVLSRDGREIPISMVIIAHRRPDGAVDFLGTISRDISERKRAEAEREALLAEIERRAAELDATITAIADGVTIYNREGRIIRMNPAAEAILGYTPAEAMLPLAERMKLQRFETVEGKPFPLEEVPSHRALEGETAHGVVMVLHPPRSGRTTWVANSAAPIRSPEGQILGAVSVFTDITPLHELQEQREDLLRTVSHDLRNPLTIIFGQTQLLQHGLERAGLKGSEYKSAEAILISARRMNIMIQDMVDTARLEAGQLHLQKEAVNLRACVDELLERSLGVMDISRIKVEIDPALPSVSADPNRLERIFTNLLTNALKYSAPGTEVLVTSAQLDGEIRVSVTDQGVGIPPEDLPHIFERYYRAKGARKAEGIGLGLYITKMLVEGHGGRIWVESEPDKGSIFYFTLPIVRTADYTD